MLSETLLGPLGQVHDVFARIGYLNILLGFTFLGVVIVIVDYARMLYLRSKMVKSPYHRHRGLLTERITASRTGSMADCW
jgi:hypothetical protein